MSSQYQETTYSDVVKTLTLPFSHDFCLIEHEFINKDESGSEQTFVFYSLYMHLDLISHHQSLVPRKLHKHKGGWNGREHPGIYGPKTCLKNGTLLYAIASEPAVTIYTNTFRLYSVVDNAGNKDALAKVGTKLWVAAGDTEFDIVDENMPSAPHPNWMYKQTSESTWDTLELDTLHSFDQNSAIPVKAGDPIGYLGRCDMLAPETSAGFTTRYQVHFEVFSKEKPIKEFVDAIINKDDLTKVSFISDLDSDGFCDPENPRDFFVKLASASDDKDAAEGETQDMTSEQIVKKLSVWDANKFTIVQHESEWYAKAESKPIFDMLLQMYQEHDLALPYKLAHEKERVNKLVWMKDVAGFDKHVWTWWPLLTTVNQIFTIDMIKLVTSGLANNYIETVVSILNEVSCQYGIINKNRAIFYVAQIAHESNFKSCSENGYYNAINMRKTFVCKKGKYDSDLDECVIGRLRDKLWTEEVKYKHNSENLLSYVYADRMGNGSETSKEGYFYRGRGLIQLTGKNNYINFTKSYNEKFKTSLNFVENPDLIIEELRIGIASSLYFWERENLN
jgi:predicted chitinase